MEVIEIERKGAMMLFHDYCCGKIDIVKLMNMAGQSNMLWIFRNYSYYFVKKLGVREFSKIHLQFHYGLHELEAIEDYLRIGLNRGLLMKRIEKEFTSPYGIGLSYIDTCEVLRRLKVPIRRIEKIFKRIDPSTSRFFFYMVTEQAEKWRAIGIDPKKYVRKCIKSLESKYLMDKIGLINTKYIPEDILKELLDAWFNSFVSGDILVHADCVMDT